MTLMKRLTLPAITICLAAAAPASAPAGQRFGNPAQHFSMVVPDGLVPLTPADLARGNAATAAEGGVPQLYEAGFAPPPGTNPRLPLVLVRYVPGRATLQSFAASYGAELAKAASQVPGAGGTTRPNTSDVVVDNIAHTVTSERAARTAEGVVVKRRTVFVGHDGVAEVSWTGTPASVRSDLPPLLASVKWDKGYEYGSPDVVVVKTVTQPGGDRRMWATALWVGGSVLFLGVAVLIFLRARRRAVP